MLIQVLKSKLKEVMVTAANTEYEGSLTLDPDLMDAAGLYENECVHVNAVRASARIVTYIISGKRGSGQVEMNGGAANFFRKGQHVHVNCFAFVNESDIHIEGIGNIVITDKNNKVIEDSNCIGDMAEESLD